MVSRRNVLIAGGFAAVGALPLWALARRRADRRRRQASGLLEDPAGIADLPPGFEYRVLERAGDQMSDGGRVPGAPDAMGCFTGPGGSWVLMRNHELSNGAGGVTRVVIDPKKLERVSSNQVLRGTSRNCAGGISPWGWLTCEEVDRGQVYLCETDASAVQPSRVIKGYGAFRHEAACVDPSTLIAYLTEDNTSSALYRFVPSSPDRPFEGKLQALRIDSAPRFDLSSRERAVGESWPAGWVNVDDPSSHTYDQARIGGAARISRGEGIWFHQGSVYVCSTDGGPGKRGQIFRLRIGAAGETDTLEVVVQSLDSDTLRAPDNITVHPDGRLYLAEDGAGTDHVRGVGADGVIFDVLRNARSGSELAGVCFSPDGGVMFVNLQRDGLTLAVRGPFAELGRTASRS